MHAVHYDADAYYRVRVDRSDATGEATAESGPPWRVRGAPAAAARTAARPAGSAQTAALSGELTVATFGQAPEMHSVPVQLRCEQWTRSAPSVSTSPARSPMLTARLASPPYPHWNVLARGQLAAGCQ